MSENITRDIRSDPLLYNLFSNNTKDDFKSTRDLNWIKIPTSFLNEDGKDSSISMLSVYTYSFDESKNIYESIRQPEGADIVFSDDGHVACNFKNKKIKADFFYPNPVVKVKPKNKPVGIENTVKFTLKNYLNSFYFSDKFLFSKNLLWILYQLPNKFYNKKKDSGIEISSLNNEESVPVYVLLYNTVHRKNFQRLYSKILNDADKTAFSLKTYMRSSSGYAPTITKYCNAFKVKKYSSPISGEDLEHYGDPSCVLAFDPTMAKLSQALSINLTLNSWKNKFYKDSKAYNEAVKSLNTIPSSEAYCTEGISPNGFIRNISKIVDSRRATNSFMQVLSNYQISESTRESNALFPPSFNNTFRSGYDPNGDNFNVYGVTCGQRSVFLTQCPIHINSTGNIEINNSIIAAHCGNKRDSTQPLEVSTKPLKDSTQPLEDSTQPLEDSTQPLEDSTQPLKEFPLEDSTQPLKEFLPMIIFLISLIILILIYIFAF